MNTLFIFVFFIIYIVVNKNIKQKANHVVRDCDATIPSKRIMTIIALTIYSENLYFLFWVLFKMYGAIIVTNVIMLNRHKYPKTFAFVPIFGLLFNWLEISDQLSSCTIFNKKLSRESENINIIILFFSFLLINVEMTKDGIPDIANSVKESLTTWA